MITKENGIVVTIGDVLRGLPRHRSFRERDERGVEVSFSHLKSDLFHT
jgi:hypothetical protein